MTWPHPPKAIRDLAGLRQIERDGQDLGAVIAAALPPGWCFALLCFEYEGGGCTHVHSLPTNNELALWCRRCADRLESGAIDLPLPDPAINLQDGARFARDAKPLGRVLKARLPVGWGFAVLVGPVATAPLYMSTADRETMPTYLREIAARIEGDEIRPPGVLGREH